MKALWNGILLGILLVSTHAWGTSIADDPGADGADLRAPQGVGEALIFDRLEMKSGAAISVPNEDSADADSAAGASPGTAYFDPGVPAREGAPAGGGESAGRVD